MSKPTSARLVAICITGALMASCASNDPADSDAGSTQSSAGDLAPAPSTTGAASTTALAATTAPASTAPGTTAPAPTVSAPPPIPEPVQDTCPSTVISGAECLLVTVPADHTDPDGPTIELAVTVRRADPARWTSPVLKINGPRPVADWSDSTANDEKLDGHDLIWIDQRGSGRSTAYPACRAMIVHNAEINLTHIDADLATQINECVQATVDAVPPLESALDPAVSAADFDLVREALGIDRWSVLARTLGLGIALHMITLDPDSIDSVVAVAPAVAGNGDTHAKAQAAFDEFAADCSAAPACAAVGDMNVLFQQEIDRLRPGVVTATEDPGTGDPIVLDEPAVLNGAVVALGDVSLAPVLPTLIAGLADGSADDVVAGYFASRQFGSNPIALVGDCQPVSFERPAMDTFGATDAGPFGRRTWRTECDAIGPVPGLKALEPFDSDVPVLAIVTAYNSMSTQESAGEIFAGFPNATIVHTPGIVSPRRQISDCFEQAVGAFLDDPSAEVDTTCLSAPGVQTLG